MLLCHYVINVSETFFYSAVNTIYSQLKILIAMKKIYNCMSCMKRISLTRFELSDVSIKFNDLKKKNLIFYSRKKTNDIN